MATVTSPPPEVLAESLSDVDKLYEVEDGQLVVKPMGSSEVQLANVLAQLLAPFARTNRLGTVFIEMIFRIDPNRNLQRRPDVAFVSHERWPTQRKIPKDPVWDMVPDLAVEVISPSNTAGKVQKKIREYFNAGVRQVWLVYPETCEIFVYDSPKEIRVWQLEDELDGAPLLPGFRLPVRTLFEDDPE